MYAKRHKFEKTSNPSVFNLPLPWTPGWRNLISGRPMGGNAFESTSYAELFRRVIQQVKSWEGSKASKYYVSLGIGKNKVQHLPKTLPKF